MKIPKLSQLIKDKKFDYVNSKITDDLFPMPEKIGTDFKLFHFDRGISSEDAIKEMESAGYSPASVYELLSWKEWNGKDFVVALGSVGKVDGRRYVSGLSMDGSERNLRLVWWVDDWLSRCRFLAVRDLSLKPSETVKGHSDTLPLDTSDIKVKLRDFINSLEELYTKL